VSVATEMEDLTTLHDSHRGARDAMERQLAAANGPKLIVTKMTLRDLTVVRTCKEAAALVDATEAELQELSKQATGEGAELVPQHFDHFARVTEEIARSSFPRLLLEMAAIEMIYERLDRPLTQAARNAMKRWGDDNRRDKRAAHSYTLEEFGYTREAICEAFAAYRNRFIVGRAEAR